MLSFSPRDILVRILTLIESASEGFPTYYSFQKKYLTDNKSNQGPENFNLSTEILPKEAMSILTRVQASATLSFAGSAVKTIPSPTHTFSDGGGVGAAGVGEEYSQQIILYYVISAFRWR